MMEYDFDDSDKRNHYVFTISLNDREKFLIDEMKKVNMDIEELLTNRFYRILKCFCISYQDHIKKARENFLYNETKKMINDHVLPEGFKFMTLYEDRIHE